MSTPILGSKQAEIFNAEFDKTEVKFHDRAATLAAIKATGTDITFEGEVPYIRYDGENLQLNEALLRFGYDRREFVDSRTLPRRGAGTARPGIDHRGLYVTVADKIAFINANGIEAWEALPTTGVQSSEVTTQAEFMKLPRAEKVRRLTADPDCFEKLARPSTGRSNVAYVNHEAIARERSLRGR